MKHMTIAASAVALLAIGMTGPTAAAAPVEIASGGSVFSLSGPYDQNDDFGNLHNRGPRAGIQGPGFVSPRPTGPVRPGYGPSAEGR
jgi:hypothetical protein